MLAVSGGRDSMVLMHACARAARRSVAIVATFDHGTGPAATAASGLVAREGARVGFPVVLGHAERFGDSEAEWRSARLAFLSDVAASLGADVATAHTRDDQVETVVMRVLRDAGARGLAGLYAASQTLRPLLDFSRPEVAGYGLEIGARWLDDPTNSSMRFLRNRVRRDLLPALSLASPGLTETLLDVARGAAEWRGVLDSLVASMSRISEDGTLCVAARDLVPFSAAELAVLWPALAARVGLAMDWRGTERAAAFTNTGRSGRRIQLSGGWEIARTREELVLRRWRIPAPAPASTS